MIPTNFFGKHFRSGRTEDSDRARESAQRRDPDMSASTSTAGAGAPAPRDELIATRPSHDARSVALTSTAGPRPRAWLQGRRQPPLAGSHPPDPPPGALSNALRAWATEGDALWSDSPAASVFGGWNEIEHEPRADKFATFLQRLHETAVAQSATRYFQARLANLLPALKKDATLRATCFTAAEDAIKGKCGDRVALEIEIAVKAHELGNPSTPKLVDLGKQFFRMNKIEEIAKENEQSRIDAGRPPRNFGEVLMVYHAYMTKKFDLPFGTGETKWRHKGVYSEELELAASRVATEEDGQEMVEFLSQFGPLKEQLEKSFPGPFNDLQKSFAERESALSAKPEGMSEREYKTLTDALKTEKAAAEQELRRALTLEVVEQERGRGAEYRAKNQYNRGNRLRELGWNKAALKVARDAARLYQGLASTSPGTFGPDLAKSLRSVWDTLKAMNLDREAIKAGYDTAEEYRMLATANPGAFRPQLAKSLSDLSKQLGAQGRHEEALEAGRGAVVLHRELAAARPDAFRPHLANSLRNLCDTLKAMNLDGEALEAGREAVDLYRELAAARPDAFRPDLADSLVNMSKQLGARTRHEEAFEAAREAVELYRELAATRPDAFRIHLTDSLNNLSKHVGARDRHEWALKAKRKEVELYRKLAAKHSTFRPRLAGSLDSLSKKLTAPDQHEEAAEAAREAVGLYRTLAEEDPSAYRPRLADSLDGLSKKLTALDRHEEALEATREVVGLYRKLLEKDFSAFRPRLADSLDSLSKQLSALNRREEAQGAAREANRLRGNRPAEGSNRSMADNMEFWPQDYRGGHRSNDT